jgi:ABC-type transporter MlaC component
MTHRIALLGICLGMMWVTGAYAATPDERTVALVDAFKSVRTAPEGKELSAEDKRANGLAFTVLDGFFNYDTLTQASIKPHVSKFSKPQLARFYTAFEELIRLISYPKSGAFLKDAQVRFGKSVVKSDQKTEVSMSARLPKEDVETRATFTWEKNKGQWYVTDVGFDGASMVKDYQNQFGRILAKEGAEGLLKRLDNKLMERRKQL